MKSLELNSEIFTRGVEDIITREALSLLLKSGRKLRIKHGIDATAPDLHLGHAASLWKLRILQEAGHKAVILLGDVTTQIGDPTGRTKARPVLSEKEIKRNAESIEKQIKKILLDNPNVLEIHKSSEWYKKLSTIDFLKLLSMITNARLLERDMFQKRIKEGAEIYEHEIVYPVLQGYDSVMLKADLTIIGSDQLFNEHVGRHFQKKLGQNPQVIVTLSILPGLEAGEKMSKSLGNHISLLDTPRDKFGKAMRLLDSLIVSYLEAYTDAPAAEIKRVERELRQGENPMKAKLFFAEALVRRYHGKEDAKKERDYFLKVFSQKNLEEIPSAKTRPGTYLATDLILALGFASSKSEARRLIEQGALRVNDHKIARWDEQVNIKKGTTIQVGKRKFAKVN